MGISRALLTSTLSPFIYFMLSITGNLHRRTGKPVTLYVTIGLKNDSALALLQHTANMCLTNKFNKTEEYVVLVTHVISDF